MRPRFRPRLRTPIFAIAGLSLAMAYVGDYYRLSRRGMLEAVDYGLDGFLYTPCSEMVASHDLRWHYLLATFYFPANWVDRMFFGGEGPVVCIMRLSG